MKQYPTKSINVGDVVLMEEDNVKRLQWKMGIVQNLISGKDGQVRGVELRTTSHGKPHILTRPIQKIYPLEVSNANVSDDNGKKGNLEKGNQKSGMGKEGKERNGNEGKIEVRSTRGANIRPQRTAASNACAKTKLMLDP